MTWSNEPGAGVGTLDWAEAASRLGADPPVELVSWPRAHVERIMMSAKSGRKAILRLRINPFAKAIASGQLKYDMQNGGGICGLAIPQCRLKADQLGSTNRSPVQTVAQTLDDT